MSMSEVEKEFIRLRNLKRSKNVAEVQLRRQAWINVEVENFERLALFTNDKEQEVAKEKFKSYLLNHQLESQSEIDSLRSLVYNEVFESRIQQNLNKLSSEDKYPPEKLTKQLTDIQNQKSDLKIKLGIDSDNPNSSELSKLQQLEKRFQAYYQENANEFTTASGCCGTMLLFRRRVKDFDNMPHPFFIGRWFVNYEMLKDVKDGKLSKQDFSRYMNCASEGSHYKPAFSQEYSDDYVNWLLRNWGEIMKHFEKK